MKDDRMRWKQNERLEYTEITVSRHVKRVDMKLFSGIVLCVAGYGVVYCCVAGYATRWLIVSILPKIFLIH